jgi:hypothetical protein
VTCCSVAQIGKDVMFNTSMPQENAPIGDALAAKVVADSKGKANALYVNVSAFQILAKVGESFQSR